MSWTAASTSSRGTVQSPAEVVVGFFPCAQHEQVRVSRRECSRQARSSRRCRSRQSRSRPRFLRGSRRASVRTAQASRRQVASRRSPSARTGRGGNGGTRARGFGRPPIGRRPARCQPRTPGGTPAAPPKLLAVVEVDDLRGRVADVQEGGVDDLTGERPFPVGDHRPQQAAGVGVVGGRDVDLETAVPLGEASSRSRDGRAPFAPPTRESRLRGTRSGGRRRWFPLRRRPGTWFPRRP